MAETPQDPVLIHLAYIREGIDGLNTRLDLLNGQTRRHGEEIAVLKDRTDDAKRQGAGWGAAAGAFIGGLLWIWHTFGGGK